MRKPRVLILENSVDFTGALNSILGSCSELKNWFDFIFVLPIGSKAIPYVTALDLPVHVLPLKEIRKSWLVAVLYLPYLLTNSMRFGRLVKRLHVDIVLCNDFYNLVPAIHTMFGSRVPYICYVRFRPSKFPQALVRFWCWFHHRYAAAVIAVSNVVKRELPSELTVKVIGNEVPSTQVMFEPATSKTILYPANYIKGKGHEFALRCFANVSRKYPEWRLKFIGSDMGLEKNRAFKHELQQETAQLGLEDVVEWGNFAKNMSEQYLNAAFVLNFSESESFSLTCLESLYYGRPAIATRSGGPEEIIDDGETGLLVNDSDFVGMESAILYLIANESKRHEFGRRGYQRVREKFSYENTVAMLKKVYESVLPEK